MGASPQKISAAGARAKQHTQVRRPASLWIYLATALSPFFIGAARGDLWNAPVAWVAFALVVGLLVLLFRGSRTVWGLAVAWESAILISDVFSTPPWWAVALSAVAIGALLAPASRRFVGSFRASVTS